MALCSRSAVEWGGGRWWITVIAAIAAALAISQVPTTFAPGSFVLKGPTAWLLVSPAGEPLVEFGDVGGRRPTSVVALPDGSGLLYTGHRDGGQDGLFLKQGEQQELELSISPGYHGWPAISPSGKTIAFVHHDAPDSGPIGQHGVMANAQLWTRSIRSKAEARLLTSSPGCKASPSFYGEDRLVFGHNSCRGTQGIETIDLSAKLNLRVLHPAVNRKELVPAVSPNRKLLVLARMHYRALKIVLLSWPELKELRELATTPEDQEFASANWTADSTAVLLTSGDQVLKVDVTSGAQQLVWTFHSVRTAP